MPNTIAPSTKDGYYLGGISAGFDSGAENMITEVDKALEELQRDPTNPKSLANYQAKLQEYTLYRSAQTSTVKAIKDICAAIIQNFR